MRQWTAKAALFTNFSGQKSQLSSLCSRSSYHISVIQMFPASIFFILADNHCIMSLFVVDDKFILVMMLLIMTVTIMLIMMRIVTLHLLFTLTVNIYVIYGKLSIKDVLFPTFSSPSLSISARCESRLRWSLRWRRRFCRFANLCYICVTQRLQP